MKLTKLLIIFTVALLVFGIAFMIYSVHNRLANTEYQFQVDALLTAASIASEEDPLTTDPDRAVIAEYEGKKYVVVPNNFRALSSFLRKDSANLLFTGPDKNNALKITICNLAVIYASPEKGNEDVVLIELVTLGDHSQTLRTRTDGGNQWLSLVNTCTTGTYHDENIPLE